MCFSAGASFAGSAVLVAAGYAAIRKVRKPSWKPFAAIPLLFSLQQFSEGIIWLILRSGGHETILKFSTTFFLIMALIVWPILMPLSVKLMEPSGKRRRILAVLISAGIILALYYAYCMIFYEFHPIIESHHIRYLGDWPKSLRNPAFALYILATIPPLFISGIRRMWIMGTLILISVIVSGIFFKVYLTSVWCFFAALISLVILWIIKEDKIQGD
ncbi:MAG: hypothetical protein MUE74_10110 [Bacteroidales bacterium]|jgi:hypothetical protein|nr:hypothetical protein [Bacteroidales bacterium]